MNPIIKGVILTGLAILPAACATYSQGYYDTGYGYSPGYYDSGYGYGIVERNYYNTYTYPTPVYRTEEHHHHHYDGHDRRHSDRHDHDGRRYSPPPGTLYPNPGSRDRDRDRDEKDHYNWNAQAAKPYDNRKFDRNRQQYGERHEGWPQRPPADSNAYGQRGHRQNWDRQESRRQNSGFEEHSPAYGRAESGWHNNTPATPKNRQDGQARQRPGRWRSGDPQDVQNGQ
jgi:hypothetical protein